MVTVYGDGTAAFVMRYTRPLPGGKKGKRVFMPLGRYGKAGLSLAEACDKHDEALKLLEKELDPLEEREKRQIEAERLRQERAGADTVGDLVQRFVRDQLASRKRPEAADALLQANVVDATLNGQTVGQMKARDLTRRQLVRLLDDIKARPAPITANRVHALLVQMFKWAAAREDVPVSPMYGVPRPVREESQRDRTLTAEETRTFWEKLETAKMAEPTKLALKLLLVTGQRRGELTFAKWKHIDLKAKLWTIPVALLKSSHTRREKPEPHAVPLSPLAVELLRKLQGLSGSSQYVLPRRADAKQTGSYSERVLSRAVRENEGHFGIERFTPHDLRRTAASFMAKLKIPRLHIAKVLNHATGDITGVYDRHDYLPEKREALEKWAAHLSDIIAGKETNVLEMPKKARA
jgi:integrase